MAVDHTNQGTEAKSKTGLFNSITGVGGKVLAVAVLPILLMAMVNVFSVIQTHSLFNASQAHQAESDMNRDTIIETNEAIKDSMAEMNLAIAEFLRLHQSSLLSEDSDMVDDNITARKNAMTEIEHFRVKIKEFSTLIKTSIFKKNENLKKESTPETDGKTKGSNAQRDLKILTRTTESLSVLYELFSDANARTMELIKDENFEDANSNFIYEEADRIQAVYDANNKIIVTLKKLLIFIAADLKATHLAGSEATKNELEMSAIQTFIILAILSATLVLFASLYAIKGLAKPMRSMSGAMTVLANGDTDLEIPKAGKDEIGDMARALSVLREALVEKGKMDIEREEAEVQSKVEKSEMMNKLANDFQSSVGEVVGAVTEASNHMRESATSMSATAEKACRQSSIVATASQKASSNVETVATAAEELSTTIKEISEQVSMANDISMQAVEDVIKTNDLVKGLDESAQKIGKVVDIITDIADQTNLLALNATIEAARAGEAGKGFAVVASEVKNLANQTAKATDEISQQVYGIQSATKDTVTSIDGIREVVTNVSEISSSIAAAIEQQQAATQEIARSVEQASIGTQEVNSNIAEVSLASEETGAVANEIAEATNNLSTQSDTLNTQVNNFLNQVRAS